MNAESEPHDYEPGENKRPMLSDPTCRVCGLSKNSRLHR